MIWRNNFWTDSVLYVLDGRHIYLQSMALQLLPNINHDLLVVFVELYLVMNTRILVDYIISRLAWQFSV